MPDDVHFPQTTKLWTDSPILYFHFNSANGGFASLPMVRAVRPFTNSFIGVPGTIISKLRGAKTWFVPGFKCVACGKVYFSATQAGLKHECMNNGGIVSDSRSMGI